MTFLLICSLILALAAGVWIDTLINNWAVKQLEKDKN